MPASHEAFTDAFLDGRGRSASLLPVGGKSPEAPLGLLWQYPIWDGERGLVTASGGGSPGSPCGLHWYCGEGREESVYHSCLVGMKLPAPYVSFSAATLAGVLGCLGTA